mgnify:CR=1 FL=1
MSHLHSLKRHLVARYGAIIAITVLLLEGLCMFAIRSYYVNTIEQVLSNRVQLTADYYQKYVPGVTPLARAQKLLSSVDKDEVALVEVLDLQGQPVLDSDGFIADYRHTTPEVSAALNGQQHAWVGKSPLTGEKILAVAAPLCRDESRDTVGVLRYSVSLEQTFRVIQRLYIYCLLVGLIVIALVLALCYSLACRILLPIEDLTIAAKRLGAGAHDVRVRQRSQDELGQLAATFNYMSSQLDAAERAKNEFLSSISHELRTPLTSIKGWSETLFSGKLVDKPNQTQLGLEIICEETDRMIGLVEDLLDYSRLQVGHITLSLETVEINDLVTEVYQQLTIRLSERHIGLTLDLQQQLPLVEADDDRLKQVLLILLDNALKFTPPDGLISIRTRFEQDIVITVADTGPGIAPEDLPFIKNKFYKGNSKLPGSGLGLSIAQNIVQLHKGRLEIASPATGGTTVDICLPQSTPWTAGTYNWTSKANSTRQNLS